MLLLRTLSSTMIFLAIIILLTVIGTQPVFAQTFDNLETSVTEFQSSKIWDFLKSPQSIFENLPFEFKSDITTIEVIAFSLGIVIYGVFIWHFYRLIARREIVKFSFNKYESDGKKITSIAVYIIKYMIVFPLVITIWFFVYSMFIFFMKPDLEQSFVFLIVISLVVAIRIAAYYKEDLSKDIAKLIPFSLLGILLFSISSFDFSGLTQRMTDFTPFLSLIVGFVIFAIFVEAILRILFLIKRKIWPVSETKLEEEIDKTIEDKITHKVKRIEEKIENAESKMEKKIETTGDKLNQINNKQNEITNNQNKEKLEK